MRRILSVIIIFLLSFSFAEAKKSIKKVMAIEFKDLKYVSKYEIIDSADVSIEGKQIVIDINSLRRALRDLSIIESFEISEHDQILQISVNEKEPYFTLCFFDGKREIPFELDRDFHIISMNRIYKANLPLVFIPGEEMNKSGVSKSIKNILSKINDIRSRNFKIIDDIIEIKYLNADFIKVLLAGRKTAFYVKPDLEGFINLNYAVGYFDMIKYYPDTFTMPNGYGIVK
ncbi:MAG: hypothetical protein JW864_07680 [Spirochaetes bacterium]|nr:hypothetical protein [Spirochaetota bacterium]